jgi:uncharacterized protein (TIRG00374 family)
MVTVRRVLMVLGVVLFAALVLNLGTGAIATSFARLSWRLALIAVFPYAMVALFDALGWRFAFAHELLPLRTLLPVRIAGEAFNIATPTASVGGEAVKAILLAGHASPGERLASVIVAKTMLTLSQTAFILIGVVLATHALGGDSPALRVMLGTLLFALLSVTGFLMAQLGGVVSRAGRVLAWAGLLRGDESGRVLASIDETLSVFYRHRPRRLALSLGCHLVSWLFTTLETYWILRLLGVPVPLWIAAVIEAFSAGVRFAVFMVPAQVGVLEGGYVVVFEALGLDAGMGLSFSLIRRIREATWVGLGFLLVARR